MKIGIVVAVTRELSSFLEVHSKVESLVVNNRPIFHTVINGNDIYAIHSGCGLIDASSATQILITKFDVELILNYGVTGALDPSLKVNDLFVVTKLVNHDFDTSSFDPVAKCQYCDYPDMYIPVSEDMIALAKKIKPDLKEAALASGNCFINDKPKKDQLFKELHCNICDMELAGIGRTCNVNKVKFLSIKSISDSYDGDGSDFNENVVRSSKVAFAFLSKILNTL